MLNGGGGSAFRTVHLDNHLLILDKSAGLPSQPDDSGDPSLIELAKDWIRREFAKPGNVYLALAHRLDRPTSGLVALARTGKAARRLAEFFRLRRVDKHYLALVEGRPPRPEGKCLDWLIRGEKGGMRVAGEGAPGARRAELSYLMLAADGAGKRSLLEVAMATGVKHQIRCQLANRGLPVTGDFRYGPQGRPARPEPVAGGRAILLHSWRLGFVHPVRCERLEFSAPPPGHWLPFLAGFPADALTLAEKSSG
ncbi:MAG: RNA pseudouridine synthase, partial [Planctomycetota bacterium]|nr:RNA pseudouridine synthase [Planctomycetota bacterium]